MSDTNDQFMHGFEITVTTALGEVPFIGTFVSALIEIFWPQNHVDVWGEIKDKVEQVVDQKLIDAHYKAVQTQLGNAKQRSGLVGLLADYTASVDRTKPNGEKPENTWQSAHGHFIKSLADFQAQGSEVLLLPLFAQLGNLHMALLKDGVTNNFCNEDELKTYLSVYEDWADQWSAQAVTDARNRPGATWTSINRVIRFMQISVLNCRTLWPYFNPNTYKPPITTDIRSNVEIFYTFKESVGSFPYSSADYSSLPPTPADNISAMTIYCIWHTHAALNVPVASQVAYSKGTSTPYSGMLYNHQPLQGVQLGQPSSSGGYYDVYFREVVQPKAGNPITSVQGLYDNTGGAYYIEFGFKDGTSTGPVPSQAGVQTHYPNKVSIVPPDGYVLSSIYTPAGGWYSAVYDVVLGFRMRI